MSQLLQLSEVFMGDAARVVAVFGIKEILRKWNCQEFFFFFRNS